MNRAPLVAGLQVGRAYVCDPNMWEGSWQNGAHAVPGSVMAGFAGPCDRLLSSRTQGLSDKGSGQGRVGLQRGLQLIPASGWKETLRQETELKTIQ